MITEESYRKLSFFNKMHFEQVESPATHIVHSEPSHEDDDNFAFGLCMGGLVGAVMASEMQSDSNISMPTIDTSPSVDTSSSFADQGGFGGGDFGGGGAGGDF